MAGDPTNSCFSPTWNGQAIINGWYTLETVYGVGKEMRLKISKDDYWKLPMAASFDVSVFKLINASPQIEEKLKSASEDDPLKFVIRGYAVYCEGAPMVSLTELNRD